MKKDRINNGELSDRDLDRVSGGVTQLGTERNDRIEGTSGGDIVLAGDGDDRVYSGSGDDYVDGGQGNDYIFAGAGDDVVSGGEGRDYISGGSGNDVLLGDGGNDRIGGGGGDDLIQGGDGNDYVYGEEGDDTLTGGEGKDTFSFAVGEGRDVLTDFTFGEDRLELLDAGFHRLSANDYSVSLQDGNTIVTLNQSGETITLQGVELDAEQVRQAVDGYDQ